MTDSECNVDMEEAAVVKSTSIKKMKFPADKPKDPRDWPLALKLDYAMNKADALIDLYPALAELWLNEADSLRAKIDANLNKI